MPNHVKNKIILDGDAEQIKSLLEKFSTTYPQTESLTYDGRIICKTSDGSYGWLDKESNVFSRRDLPSVLGIPPQYEIDYVKEWTRFPDFEKVFPTPEVIKLVGDSVCSNITNAVYAKYMHPLSDNPLLASLEYQNRFLSEHKIKPEDELQFERACLAYEQTGFCYWYDFNQKNWGTKWNAYSCETLSEKEFTFETAWSNVLNIVLEISKSFEGNIVYAYADENTGYNTGSYLICKGIVISELHYPGGSIGAYEMAFDLRPELKENYRLVGDTYEYIDEDED